MKKEKTPRSFTSSVLRALALTMPAKTIRAVIACAGSAGIFAATANATDITWQAPTTISGASDVSTLGTLVGTWAPGDDAYNPDSLPVNGVTFNAYGSGPFNSFVSTSGLDDRFGDPSGGHFASPGTADPNYNYLLQTAIYSFGESISLTWSGMTPGNTYELEFWVNDGRNSVTAERSETLTGGANTSIALTYGTGVSGTGPGQFILPNGPPGKSTSFVFPAMTRRLTACSIFFAEENWKPAAGNRVNCRLDSKQKHQPDPT